MNSLNALQEHRPVSIANIEAQMFSLPQAECPVTHRFEDGCYIRELHMKAGTFAVGHHQNFEHANIFVQGKVLMLNDDGSTTLLTAPMIFKGKPGRKVGYVLEDVIWQNCYVTEERDVSLLEALLLTKSAASLEHSAERYLDEYFSAEPERADYEQVIKSLGMSEQQVLEQVENKEDQIELPDGAYKVKVDISSIHGRGIIGTAPIEAGEDIGIARSGVFRTPLGRFTNHSSLPNAEMRPFGENIHLVARFPIPTGAEVTIDYGATIRQLKGD